MNNERNYIIQTVAVSLILPVLHIYAIALLRSYFTPSLMIWIFISCVYYSIVMRKRKNDKFLDSYEKRIKISSIIQFITMILTFIVLRLSENNQEAENLPEKYNFIIWTIIIVHCLIEPFAVLLSGFLFKKIFVSFPKTVCEKIRNFKNQ